MNKGTLKRELERLAIHTNDSVDGYKKAAERLDKMDSPLASHFRAQAVLRSSYAKELNSRLECIGEDAKERNSLEGKVHHALIAVKDMFTSDDSPEAVINEAIRGEEKLIDYIEDTFDDLDVIDGATSTILKNFKASVRESIAFLKQKVA